MIAEGGIRSLWRGNYINVMRVAPEYAMRCTLYEQIKKNMGQEGQPLAPFSRFLCGTLAAFISQSVIYPFEVIRTRLALRKSGESGRMTDMFRNVYHKEGIKAFYRGYIVNSFGMSSLGIDLAIYETLKSHYRNKYPENPQPSVVSLLAIANGSSTVAMLATYPLFLIKTRMQSGSDVKETIFSIARHVYAHNGIFGFYKGSLLNIAKVAPAATFGHFLYEYFSNNLKKAQ
jgi:solute carrier family 25 phosphate transporter 23/24/25/41